jgi:hypothetical protein
VPRGVGARRALTRALIVLPTGLRHGGLGLRRGMSTRHRSPTRRATRPHRPRDHLFHFMSGCTVRAVSECIGGHRELRTSRRPMRFARVLAPLAPRASLSLRYPARGSRACSPTRRTRRSRARVTKARSTRHPLRGECGRAAVPEPKHPHVIGLKQQPHEHHTSTTKIPQESHGGRETEGLWCRCRAIVICYHR